MAFSVRPDMLGVALVTGGVFLVLAGLAADPPRTGMVAAAYVAFALALCIKQHYVVCPLVCTVLLVTAWRRGRIGRRALERSVLAGLVIVLCVYAAEELATGGRMTQSVFRAAAHTSRVHPGDWIRTAVVMLAICGQSSALTALLIAAGLAGIAPRRSLGLLILTGTATGLIGLIAMRSCVDFMELGHPRWELLLTVFNVLVGIAVVLPVCFVVAGDVMLPGLLDRVLLVAIAGECAWWWRWVAPAPAPG